MSGKTLCLMRHSQSVLNLSENVLTDFDKPLTDKGINELANVRTFLKKEQFLPDMILCSPALRTRQTLEWIEEALGEDAETIMDSTLYGINKDQLFEKITNFPQEKSNILIIGHNPAISDTMEVLLTHADIKHFKVTLPAKPAQLLIFESDALSWHTFFSEPCRLNGVYESEC